MPLDAVCLTGVVRELQRSAVGARVEKVQQPARDQIVLTLRGNRRLLLCAGANQARIHLTAQPRENPAAPPMFCMLLRKHLSGGVLTEITQPSLERVVFLTFQVLSELGEPGQRQLVLECMGRRSNLVLLDGEGRIIDCLRRVDLEMNQQRQVLPGLFYRMPPALSKEDPLAVSRESFAALARGADGKAIDDFLLDDFFGLSPLICRELAFRACGETDGRLDAGDEGLLERLENTFFDWQDAVKENRFSPTLLQREGKPLDFSYCPIGQYGPAAEVISFDTFSALLDAFYEARDRQERSRQRGQDLHRAALTARDRVARKIALQEQELAETEQRETWRLCGELITANLYRLGRGETMLRAENYYEEGCPQVEIPLDGLLTPQENAARYFRRYQKAKTARLHLTEQLEKGRDELAYLNSVLDELSRAELEQDFLDIRAELAAAGYLRGQGRGKREPRRAASRPREFRSSGGFRILVGRSNTQNDRLVREADKRDLWFHTQKIHGSHVILCTGGQTPDDRSVTEAATLAAWFSQGQESSLVPVDYTQVKNVKKPAGARPGMVTYTTYQTAFVRPDKALVQALAVSK